MKPHIEFRVDRRPMSMRGGIDIRVLLVGEPGDAVMLSGEPVQTPAYVNCVVTAPLNEMTEIPPAFTLLDDSAQQLCDALWEAGIRPTNGAGSTGQLAATQAHLRDMKKIAFHTLKIQGE